MSKRHLAIDLYCGLGGWAEGLLATGWRVIGFDVERHQYWAPDPIKRGGEDGSKNTKPLEKRGWTQGCAVSLGLEGTGKRPRTRRSEYPGELVLQDVRTLHGSQFRDADLIVASPPCQKYSYMAMPWTKAKELREKYEACEASRKELNALFDACFRIQREASEAAGRYIPMVVENVKGAQRWVGRAKWHYGSYYLWGDVPALMPMTRAIRTPDCNDPREGHKSVGLDWSDRSKRGQDFTRIAGRQAASSTRHAGIKQGGQWFADNTGIRRHAGRSNARKQASAEIAKIPFALSEWIGRVFHEGAAEDPQVTGGAEKRTTKENDRRALNGLATWPAIRW